MYSKGSWVVFYQKFGPPYFSIWNSLDAVISTLLDCRSVSVDNCRFHLNITSTFSLFNSSLYLFLCFSCRPVGGYLNSRNWNGHQEVRLYDGGHLAQWLAWPPHTNIWSDLQSGDVEKSFIFHCWFQIIKINEEGWRWWGGEAESRYETTEEARSQSLGKLWPHQTMTRGHWVSSHTHTRFPPAFPLCTG